MKEIIINIDIFDFEMYFLLGTSKEFISKYNKFLSYGDKNEADYDGEGITCIPYDRRTYSWIKENTIKNLLHECNHAIQAMLDTMGIEKQGLEQTELISNLREYIFPKLLIHFGHIKKSSLS